MTLVAPKSGEHDDQIAPRLAAASMAIERLGHVRQVAADPVAGAHAGPTRPAATRATSRSQLAVGQLAAAAVLAAVDDRGRLGSVRAVSSACRA